MKIKFLLSIILFFLLMLMVSCDDENDENNNPVNDNDTEIADKDASVPDETADLTNNDNDSTELDEDEITDEDVINDEDSDTQETTATCKEIIANFHAAEYYVVFKDFAAYDTEGDYDLYIIKYDGGPAYFLNANATGINLGNEKSFSEITEAPSEGYLSDDAANESYVIGSSYRTGGSGTTGFTMSNNVYIIKTAEDKYAKVIFTQAKAGVLKMNVCYQADGSTDISGDVK